MTKELHRNAPIHLERDVRTKGISTLGSYLGYASCAGLC